jgi:hypothetical protein
MDPHKTKILLVANSKYPNWGDSQNKNIENALVNIEKLESIIKDDEYFGIKDESQLISILNKSSQDILLRIRKETEKCDDRNKFERLIFYYCGHGIPGEDGVLFFASNDTIRDDYELTAVNSKILYKFLRKFGAKELIVIIDCCYAAQSAGNAGDEATLIEKCLPKDNVAKFNPKEITSPTYFTEALIEAIKSGTDPAQPFLRVEELLKNLNEEIQKLKRNKNNDIPLPYPIREGLTDNFEFCRNKKVQNEEDIDWEKTKSNLSLYELNKFTDKYPDGNYTYDAYDLKTKIIAANKNLTDAISKNDYSIVIEIMKSHKEFKEIFYRCKKIIDELGRASNEPPSTNLKSDSTNNNDLNDKLPEIESEMINKRVESESGNLNRMSQPETRNINITGDLVYK